MYNTHCITLQKVSHIYTSKLRIKKGEHRDSTKTNGTSVGCKCSTELVFGIIVCNVKQALSLKQITIQTFYNTRYIQRAQTYASHRIF